MEERHAQVTVALNWVAEKSGTLSAQYNTRDQVWLEGKNLRLPYQATKLAPKRYGPFKIIKEISPVAYQLALPLTWKIHDMFHTSLLSPYCETTAYSPNFSRPPPDLINDEEQYEVEQIRNHQYFGRNRTLQYLIHWKGYPNSDDTWESTADTHASDLIKAYHKGTPLKGIKAGWLSLQTPISCHPGHQPRTTWLGRHSLDPTTNPSLSVLLSIAAPPTSIHHSQIHCLPSWTTDPSHSRPHTPTPILLPRTPLHLSHLTTNITPSYTLASVPPLTCQITPSMPPPNCPQEATLLHPHHATCPILWKLYLPTMQSSTPAPSAILLLVWSRPSRTTKTSIALQSSHSKTRSSSWNQPSKGMLKHTSEPQMDTSATPCTPTSRSLSVKGLTQRPTGSPLPTMGTYKSTVKSRAHWTSPTHFPSMPRLSTHPSPSTPFLPGSISYLSVPPPFTLTSPKQPTNLMTGC